MGRFSEVLFLVLGQLAVGGIFLLKTLPQEKVGGGFFKFNSFLFLVIMGIALTVCPIDSFGEGIWETGEVLFFFLSFFLLFVYHITLWTGHVSFGDIAFWIGCGAGLLGIIGSGMFYRTPQVPFLSVSFLISAFVLGSGVLGMNLGHSYLTNPSLSILPLLRLSRIFRTFMVLEASMTILYLFIQKNPGELWNILLFSSFDGLFLWIRLLIGILFPLVLSFMIVITVRYRATMSATGLLYIAMTMVLAGETVARFFLLSNAFLL